MVSLTMTEHKLILCLEPVSINAGNGEDDDDDDNNNDVDDADGVVTHSNFDFEMISFDS